MNRVLIASLAFAGAALTVALLFVGYWIAALVVAVATLWACGWVERHRNCIVTRAYHVHRSPNSPDRW